MNNIFINTLQLYKDAYSGHSKEIWTLAILTFINRLGTMVLPFLSIYLTTELDFTLKEAGYLISAFGIGSLAGTFSGGKLSDKFGAYVVINISLIFSGLLLIILQWAISFNEIYVLIFSIALVGEAYRPAIMALMGSIVPKAETGRSLALIRLAINLGFGAGPAIGGWLAASLSYSYLFWIDGLTCIFAALFFISRYKTWEKKQQIIQKNTEETEVKSKAPYKHNIYLLFLLATLIQGFAFIQWFNSVPVFLKNEWSIDEKTIGLLLGMNGLIIALIEMPLVHYLEKNKLKKTSMIIGLILLSFSLLPFLLPNGILICIFSMALLTFGEILYMPMNSTFAIHLCPDDRRGEYMAWYSMSWSMAHILGPTLGLAFIAFAGYPLFWLLNSVLCMGSLFLYLILFKNEENVV